MRRTKFAVIAGLLTAFAAFPDKASAQFVGDYTQYIYGACNEVQWAAPDVVWQGNTAGFAGQDSCSNTADPRVWLSLPAGQVSRGAYRQFVFASPPGTKLDWACVSHDMRRGNNLRPEILSYPGFALIAAGGDGSTGGYTRQCFDLDHEALLFRMLCNDQPCEASSQARLFARDFAIWVKDLHDPGLPVFDGSLTREHAWMRGTQDARAVAGDFGSGLKRVEINVNGDPVATTFGNCPGTPLNYPWNRSLRLQPCEAGVQRAVASSLDSSQPPFRNGLNAVNAIAVDYSHRSRISTRHVLIDNAPPVLPGFPNAQDPNAPEVLRASVADEHSGIASVRFAYRPVGAGGDWMPVPTKYHAKANEATAQVDPDLPAGEYEFRLEAADVAGNGAATTTRLDGSPMRLRFPLREPVKIVTSLGKGGATGQTVPYGTKSEVHGRLVDANSNPLANQTVVVVDHFENGALFPTAERPTTTDEQGRFTTPVPAGPTRSIEAVFAGTRRYQPADDEVGKFAVKSGARFKISADQVPEGASVRFTGKVRHKGARIPARGKLLELQVRMKTGRWDTIGQAFRTDEKGHYERRYRFGRHYVQDAVFSFRVKVQKEGNWPYRRAASQHRKLIVRAR